MDLKPSKVYDNILQVIGNTPLVKLHRIPMDHGLHCELYAKCEFLNPGGSIKDRISYKMMLEAERQGTAKPGTRFVEPTSGNTGIGVALAAAVHGYNCTIVTPDKNSDEKLSTIRLLGADIVQTPTLAKMEEPDSFVSVAKQIIKENENNMSLDQYSNEVNPQTHYDYTGQEILSALGHVDMLVIGSGTGGTVTGVARKIKEMCPHCIVVAVDPKGSTIFREGEPKLFFVEGIGGDFVPDVLDKSIIDIVEHPNDFESFNMAREVIRKEGLLCGGSSGAAMFAAVKAAKDLELGIGKRVVVILADGIRNYMTKFVCDQWMEAHHFKRPPRHQFMWWNHMISNLDYNKSVPHINEESSCTEAVVAMGTKHTMIIVVDHHGFFKGVVSKDNLRHEATNPRRDETLNLKDPVKKHLMKNYYKVVENQGISSIGLVSRILDIAPFVLVLEDCHQNGHTKTESFMPKGVITPDVVFNYIINHQETFY